MLWNTMKELYLPYHIVSKKYVRPGLPQQQASKSLRKYRFN